MPGKIMAKITAKGGLTLPKSVRDAVGLKPGDDNALSSRRPSPQFWP